jgi:hypothetical protein
MAEASRFRGLLVFFAVRFPSFISLCCFGGSRPREAIKRNVPSSTFADLAMAEPELVRDPEFQIARGLAIESYANLERALCYVFGHLLGARQDRSSLVFFRIINYRSRNTIISDLLEKQYGTEFDVYWHGQPGGPGVKKLPGLFNLIRTLDDGRNEIVHWQTVHRWGRDENTRHSSSSEELVPHIYFSKSTEVVAITKDGLKGFKEKTDFASGSTWMFYKVMAKDSVKEPEIATWLQIFQQPVIYPPSDNHPLSPNYKAP